MTRAKPTPGEAYFELGPIPPGTPCDSCGGPIAGPNDGLRVQSRAPVLYLRPVHRRAECRARAIRNPLDAPEPEEGTRLTDF